MCLRKKRATGPGRLIRLRFAPLLTQKLPRSRLKLKEERERHEDVLKITLKLLELIFMDRNHTRVPLSNARFRLVPVVGEQPPQQPRGQEGGAEEQAPRAHPAEVKSGCTLTGSVTLGESLSSVPQRLRWLRKGPAPGFRGHNGLWLLPAVLCRGVLRPGHSVEAQGSSSMRPEPGHPFGCLAMLLLPSPSPPVPSMASAPYCRGRGPLPTSVSTVTPPWPLTQNYQLTPSGPLGMMRVSTPHKVFVKIKLVNPLKH